MPNSKRRSIQTRFWEDPFVEELSPSEKLLFLYLITGPMTNIVGIYEVSLKRINYDTGIGLENIKKAFERFSKEGKAFYIDSYVILPNFLKNQSLNNNMKAGAASEFDQLPKWLKEKILGDDSESLGNDSERFESIRNHILKLKIENESKNESKNEGFGSKSCLFKNSPYYDFETFKKAFEGSDYEKYDLAHYYEKVKNWADSKNAMKADWVATARNFILNDKDSDQRIVSGSGADDGRIQEVKKWRPPLYVDRAVEQGYKIDKIYRAVIDNNSQITKDGEVLDW